MNSQHFSSVLQTCENAFNIHMLGVFKINFSLACSQSAVCPVAGLFLTSYAGSTAC